MPDGLLEYAQYQIQNPDEYLSNFGINNTLQNCLEELQTSLEDKKELQGICFSCKIHSEYYVCWASLNITISDLEKAEKIRFFSSKIRRIYFHLSRVKY